MSDEKKKEVEVPTLESQHYFLLAKEIESSSAEEVMKFILERNLMDDKPSEIRLIIHSAGGETQSAFAITDVIEASSIPVYTYGLGNLQSAALAIFIAGDKGHRYLTKNTSILSHQFSWGTSGKEHDLYAGNKEINLTTKRIFDHFKKHTKQPEKVIRKTLLPPSDVWLTANEAVKYGCADVIMKAFG